MQSIFILFWREHPLVDLASSLLWVPLFTLGVLSFRYQYNKRQWHKRKVASLIGISLASVLLIAITVAATNQAITLAIFWNDLFDTDAALKPSRVSAAIAQLLFNNTISTSMFVSIWVLLYISITSTRRIHQAELDTLKLANRLKEARLGELSAQLNPHFLFNSLNNIRFTLHENPDKADDAITALSDILRYSLATERRNEVTLEEEMDVVEQYLMVVALQLESRLNIFISLQESTRSRLIPPMSIQPLVENAIKHGIEPNMTPGQLRISSHVANNALELNVWNTKGVPTSRDPPLPRHRAAKPETAFAATLRRASSAND